MRCFEAVPGRARTVEKFFFAGFAFFTSKWNYCRVTGPQNKIFIQNQLTLMCRAQSGIECMSLLVSGESRPHGFFLTYLELMPHSETVKVASLNPRQGQGRRGI
jgi:hypothetical protein